MILRILAAVFLLYIQRSKGVADYCLRYGYIQARDPVVVNHAVIHFCKQQKSSRQSVLQAAAWKQAGQLALFIADAPTVQRPSLVKPEIPELAALKIAEALEKKKDEAKTTDEKTAKNENTNEAKKKAEKKVVEDDLIFLQLAAQQTSAKTNTGKTADKTAANSTEAMLAVIQAQKTLTHASKMPPILVVKLLRTSYFFDLTEQVQHPTLNADVSGKHLGRICTENSGELIVKLERGPRLKFRFLRFWTNLFDFFRKKHPYTLEIKLPPSLSRFGASVSTQVPLDAFVGKRDYAAILVALPLNLKEVDLPFEVGAALSDGQALRFVHHKPSTYVKSLYRNRLAKYTGEKVQTAQHQQLQESGDLSFAGDFVNEIGLQQVFPMEALGVRMRIEVFCQKRGLKLSRDALDARYGPLAPIHILDPDGGTVHVPPRVEKQTIPLLDPISSESFRAALVNMGRGEAKDKAADSMHELDRALLPNQVQQDSSQSYSYESVSEDSNDHSSGDSKSILSTKQRPLSRRFSKSLPRSYRSVKMIKPTYTDALLRSIQSGSRTEAFLSQHALADSFRRRARNHFSSL